MTFRGVRARLGAILNREPALASRLSFQLMPISTAQQRVNLSLRKKTTRNTAGGRRLC
jgi:hypothetical protein